MRAGWLAACAAVAAAGCGDHGERDHTRSFVACLTRHGGTTVTTASQVASLPWRQAESGSGFRLDRLVYDEIYVGGRAIVVLFPLGLRKDNWTDEDLQHVVQTDPGRLRAVVLMPPEPEPEQELGETDEACREKVAPGEVFP